LNGALIESHMPLAVDSIHRIAWDATGQEISAEVRVRHVTEILGADGEHVYRVGVEFVAPSPVLTEQIQHWLTVVSGQIDASGA
jgi:hypothetical protein